MKHGILYDFATTIILNSAIKKDVMLDKGGATFVVFPPILRTKVKKSGHFHL